MIKNLKIVFQKILGDNKIIQYSPPRTGSTLVYNVLREVFPDKKIEKTHNYETKFSKYPVVVSYRHPLDSIASSIQRYGRTVSDEEITAQIQEFNKTGIWDILKIRRYPNVLMLKYEEFYNNHDYIYDRMEKFFPVSIPAEQRRNISGQYNIDAVSEMVREFDNFQTYNKVTQLHGKHISAYKGEAFYYKNFFNPQQVEYLKKVYKDLLVAFYYE